MKARHLFDRLDSFSTLFKFFPEPWFEVVIEAGKQMFCRVQTAQNRNLWLLYHLNLIRDNNSC